MNAKQMASISPRLAGGETTVWLRVISVREARSSRSRARASRSAVRGLSGAQDADDPQDRSQRRARFGTTGPDRFYKAVHVKLLPAHAICALIVARKSSSVSLPNGRSVFETGRPGTGVDLFTVRIEDVGLAEAGHGVLEDLDAEGYIHRDRQPPGQNLADEPIDDGRQIDEPRAMGMLVRSIAQT